MKTRITLLLLFVIGITATAQDTVQADTSWKFGGVFSLTVSQTGFTNWSAGGENSYSGSGRVGLKANYAEAKTIWENNFDVAYGRAKQGEQDLRKTDDFIEFNSKYGYKANAKWYYSALINAKTQLENGYKYAEVDSIADERTSGPMSPFRLNLALGMEYKPDAYTSVFMSPLNLKNIYVSDTTLGKLFSIDPGENLRTDFGAVVNLKYERTFYKKVNFLTKFGVFANYKELSQVDDLDLDWEILLTMNVFKVFSLNINTHLIWDKDVKFTDSEGNIMEGSKVQFKEIVGAGIAYKF